MTKYKKGDKVVLSLPKIGKSIFGGQLLMFYKNCEQGILPDDEAVLGKLEDFQPKEEKIKFTPEMKKEFDKLKTSCPDLNIALSSVQGNLSCWLNHNETNREDDEHQYLFSLAWHSPSLIEVIEQKKHEVKVGQGNDERGLLFSCDGRWTFGRRPARKYTLDEVKEAEKQLGIQGLQAKWHEAAKEASE